MESSLLPLELVHEHRNYLATVGPLVALLYYLLRPWTGRRETRFARLGALAFVGFFALVTGMRAEQWGNPVTHAGMEVAHHPRSSRAHYQLGRTYYLLYGETPRQDYLDLAREHFQTAAALSDHRHKPSFALIQLAYLAGEEPGPAVLLDLRRRLEEGPLRDTVASDLRS